MEIQLIRNATVTVKYAGKKFLIDPMLSSKGSFPAFPNSLRGDDSLNPLVELPLPVNEILDKVDAVFLSHLHIDHYDDTAKELLPKELKIFVQNESDKKTLEDAGFVNIEILTENTIYHDIVLSRTEAQHGRGEILKLAGHVCGCVLNHPSEKTLYIAADTVWFDGVQHALDKFQPEVIVLNGGDNQFVQGGSLIMGKQDIRRTYKAAPQAKIIVTHMEAVNHYTLTRKDLKDFIKENSMKDNVFVPDDGELYII